MSAPPLAPNQKLLVLTSTYPRWKDDPEPGFVHELCRRLTADFDVRVLCPHAPDAALHETMDGIEIVRYRYAPENLETLVNNGGIVGNLKRSRWKGVLVPFFLLGQLWATWREIRRWRPDVVHAHWIIPQGLIIALLKIVDRRTPPFLVTSHGADLFALRSPPILALKKLVTRRASALTVVSKAMQQELEQLGALSGVHVAPMGVDLSHRFIPPDDSTKRARQEILFVGRFVEKKGLKYLIAAMPEVLSKHPQAKLTVVGFGPEEAERRAQAKNLGIADKVIFTGAIPQARLAALYQRASVFVAPFVQSSGGDQDGLGLVLIEALGCECPVIVSDLETCKDVVDGVPGIHVVKNIEKEKLGAALVTCLKEIDVRWSQASLGREELINRFSWENVARRYAQILSSVNVHRVPKE